MDLQALCELLRSSQLAEQEKRRAAEQQLNKAASDSPNQLIAALAGLLAAGSVEAELRQEAAVILRQMVEGVSPDRQVAWTDLEEATRQALMTQLLMLAESDPSAPMKKNIGQVVAAIADKVAHTFDDLAKEWPALLPTLSRLVTPGTDPVTRVVALDILTQICGIVCEGLIDKGGEQVIAMLTGALRESVPELRCASAKLSLAMIERRQDTAPLTPVMAPLIVALQGFANELQEDQLKDVLTALTHAVEEDPDFFKEIGFAELWATLVKLCEASAATFGDEDIRHQAMEAAMTLVVGLAEDPCVLPQIEKLVELNVIWMLVVEEDVQAWTAEGKDDDEDDCDPEDVQIGEDNMDRLGENVDDEILMPMLFKVIRAALASPEASWKHMRSAIMAISQVIEHVEDAAWVEQCVDFVTNQATHQHPRVRYAAFWALSQICYDQEGSIASRQEAILQCVLPGIDDENIRVATSAVNAFTSLGEDVEYDAEDEFVKELLQRLLRRLQAKESIIMQENCLSAIAIVAEEADDLFCAYYGEVMPLLKQVIANACSKEERGLRGKAFECVSLVGNAVGKEIFAEDARATMEALVKVAQAGFASDDPQKGSVELAAGRIAQTLGKEFKPYMSALLPPLFATLDSRPKEIEPKDMPDEDDEDEPDMSLEIVGDKILGLKTSVLTEMKEALESLNRYMKALEDAYGEFLPATCQKLLSLLDMTLSDELRDKVYKSWEIVVECARTSVDRGCFDIGILRELVTEVLKKIVGKMAEATSSDVEFDDLVVGTLQAQAVGVAGVVKKAGAGVLSADALKDIASVMLVLLKQVGAEPIGEEDGVPENRRRGLDTKDQDEESEFESDEEPAEETSLCSLRFALADVMSALMRAGQEAFAETSLRGYMEHVHMLVQTEKSVGRREVDRTLAYYIADDAVEHLGALTVPYWNGFMNQALQSVTDKSATVRQYATSTLGNSSSHPQFKTAARAAAQIVFGELKKHGDRHKRRRAVKADSRQAALAIDAAILALGQIVGQNEAELGEHAEVAWEMWLSNLPLRYDVEAGQKALRQLLGLLAMRREVFGTPERQRSVVQIIADSHKTSFSNSELDTAIVQAVASIGADSARKLCEGLPERTLRKVEHIIGAAARMASN